MSTEALIEAGYDPAIAPTVKPMRGRGCDRCGKSGYKGRVGLFEVMEVTEGIRQLVLNNDPVSEIRKQAVANGMITLRQSGLRKVRDGVTTIEEVVRETVE